MHFHDQVLSEEDFEQLPPALRRKYFSSLERLRLAKDANASGPNFGSRCESSRRLSSVHPLSLRKESVSSAGSNHRSFSVVNLLHSRGRPRSRLRKAPRQPILPSTRLVSPWEFAALPRAIQRKHFSSEEQYYIASRFNPVILDAADEALYKQYQQPQKLASITSFDSGFEDTNDILFVEEEDFDDMDIRDMESFKWLDNDNDLDLKLDDYHAISADLNSKHSTMSPNRRSFRRGLSLSNVSFRRRSSSSTSLQSPPPIGSNINKTTPPPAMSLPQSRHRRLDSSASLDPSATHYQDPAAKMKLRVYLASPQKFDEALEFGFPSLHQDTVQSPVRPQTSPGFANDHPKTFFADDTPSLSEDESRDGRSDYMHQDSPRTPIDMSFPIRPSQRASTERPSQRRPRVVREVTEIYPHASVSDREMTLRMTLTRPELRVLEETDHAKTTKINETPLEKAPLIGPVSEPHTIWDELPEEPSRVKRFFKKLKGRV